jgi:PAS domain S-box-containing protein
MPESLHLLLVDDSDDDARLLLHELERGGLSRLDWQRVDTESALTGALQRQPWDIILCDYAMPQLSVAEVMRVVRAAALDVPVLIVSGHVGEEYAVEALRLGARDYIRKDNLARLIPAITRERREAHNRWQAAQAVRQSEERFSNAFQCAPIGMVVVGVDARLVRVNRAFCTMLGYTEAELLSKSIPEITHPADIDKDIAGIAQLLSGAVDRIQIEKRYLHKTGRVVWADLSASVIRDPQGAIQYAIVHIQDITEAKQARDTLRMSEEQFRSMIEQSLDLIAVLNPDGTVRYASPSHERVLGWAADELVGRNSFDLVHPDDLSELYDTFNRGMATSGFSVSMEFRFRHKDGSWRTMEGSAKNLFHDPIIAGAVVTSRDITERKRGEAERTVLLEIARDLTSTLQLEDLLDRVHRRTASALPCDRVATYAWQPERGTFELLGHYGIPSELLARHRSVALAADHPLVQSLATGQPLVLNDGSVEARVPAELLSVQETRNLVAVPLMLRQQLQGAVVAVRTGDAPAFEAATVQLLERIAQEVALAIDRAQFYRAQQEEAAVAAALVRVGRELISSLDQPALLRSVCSLMTEIVGCDVSHTFLWDPSEAVFYPVSESGATAELWESLRVIRFPHAVVANLVARLEREEVVQVVTSDPQDLLPSELPGRFGVTVSMYVALRRGGELIGIQTAGYHGATTPFTSRQVRIAEGIGHLASLALANTRVVEELERLSRLKSDFVATMSHELRTPLNVILGYNDLLRDAAFGPVTPAQIEALDHMQRSAGDLLDLITATLDLSRLETGQLPIDVQAVTPTVFLEQIAREARELLDKPAVCIEWTVAPALPELWTDPVKLKVVLKNLIGNAIKFTERGTVGVRAATRDGGMEIIVADTGIGIAAEILPVIFEPFRQGDSSATRRHGGVGLGLYIVRRLLSLIGGTIDVESIVGRGSTFRVWLPRRCPESPASVH